MTKKFICVQGSPEIPKGTIAEWDVVNQCYSLYNEKFQVDSVRIVIDDLGDWQVEGNSCWEEVKEETISPTPPKRFKPEIGQPFYCINKNNFIKEDEWDGTLGDQRKWDIGNCFQTEQDARDEVKRRESIANAWRPQDGEWCWIWSYEANGAVECVYSSSYTSDYYIGAIHPTKEACQIWGETDAHLFLPKTE